MLFLAAFLALAGLATYFLALINQAYYHSGLEVNLRSEGFRIRKVAPGSPADLAGLSTDMILVELNGQDSIQLSGISESDLPAFLHISSQLFRTGQSFSARTADGQVLVFQGARLSWPQRFGLLSSEIISNLITGILFILAGVWLLAIGKGSKTLGWFSAFCIFMGPAVALSFFISYWSPALLAARFLGLDVFGLGAAVCLISFVHHFPAERAFRPVLVIALGSGLFGLKYGLAGLGVLEPYGPALLMIHIAVALALLYTIVLLILQYRDASAGGRRRLRWVLAGITLSLVPYVLYMLSLLFRPSILTTSTEILNFVSSYAMLVFPLTVGIGVVKYRLFDIDQLLNRFTLLAFLAFCATVAYTLIFLVLLETSLSLEIYILLLLTALVSPWANQYLEKFVNYFFYKRHKDRRQILLEMEQELVGVMKREDLYPIVSAALISAFYPVTLEFIKVTGAGRELVYGYPQDSPELPVETIGSITLTLGKRGSQDYLLRVGRKRDDDIYTRDDVMLLDSVAAQVSKAFENCDLYNRLQESLHNESNAQRTAILTLAKLTEYRDNETGRHLERIQDYSRLLAAKLQADKLEADYLTDAYIEDLCLSSILHDIGKVGIPDHILLKPDKLSQDEFSIMKTHPLIGGKVLEEAESLNPDRSFLAIGKLVAYHHHEKWDGSGYPHGLKGTDIPLSARIVAVADVYDALRSDRPYKKAFSHETAMQIILADSGIHFDPTLTKALEAIEGQFREVKR